MGTALFILVMKEKFLQDQNAKGGVLDCNVLEV